MQTSSATATTAMTAAAKADTSPRNEGAGTVSAVEGSQSKTSFWQRHGHGPSVSSIPLAQPVVPGASRVQDLQIASPSIDPTSISELPHRHSNKEDGSTARLEEMYDNSSQSVESRLAQTLSESSTPCPAVESGLDSFKEAAHSAVPKLRALNHDLIALVQARNRASALAEASKSSAPLHDSAPRVKAVASHLYMALGQEQAQQLGLELINLSENHR